MTQREEIEVRLKNIHDDKRLYMAGGRIIEGFEDEHERLSAEEEELQRQLEQLMSTATAEDTSMESPAAKTAEVVRFMQQATRELAAERYSVALTLLSKALTYAEPTEEPLIEQRIDEVQRRQASRARALEREFEQTLKTAEPDLEKAERLLLHLEQVDPNWPRLNALRQELEAMAEQFETRPGVDSELLAKLQEADQALRSGAYQKAIEDLGAACDLAPTGDRPGIKSRLADARTRQAQAASAEDGWLDEELGKSEPDIAACERALERLEHADPYWPRLPTLCERLEQKRDEQREREEEASLRRELDELWKDGTYATTTDALNLARSAVAKHPGWASLRKLEEEAERRREQAAKQEGSIQQLTALGAEGAGKIYEELQELAKTRAKLPLFVFDPASERWTISDRGEMPAQETLDEAARVANKLDTDKAREKLLSAKASMPKDPETALRLIDEGLERKHAGREQLDELKNYRKVVQKAVDKRTRVEAELARARRNPNVDAAWRAVAVLADEDPHAPGLGPTLKQLRERLCKEKVPLLEDGGRKCKARDWADGAEIASKILQLVTDDEELADLTQRARALADACADGQRLESAVSSSLPTIQGLIVQDWTTAGQQLATLEKQLAEWDEQWSQFGKWKEIWSEVGNVHVAIEAQQDFRKTLRKLEERLVKIGEAGQTALAAAVEARHARS